MRASSAPKGREPFAGGGSPPDAVTVEGPLHITGRVSDPHENATINPVRWKCRACGYDRFQVAGVDLRQCQKCKTIWALAWLTHWTVDQTPVVTYEGDHNAEMGS